MMLGVSVACGLLAGFAPSLFHRSGTLQVSMASGGRTVTMGRRLRGVLAGAQLALSLALVTGSLLLVATMQRLHSVDLGFDPTGTSHHLVNPSRQGYTTARSAAYFADLQTRLTGRAGLDVVSLAGLAPFSSSTRVRIEDPAETDRPPVEVNANNIDSRYFDVLRIRIVQGRGFTDAEARLTEDGDYPVVIDQLLARRLFGDGNPIGRLVVIPAAGNRPDRHAPVVGVAADTHWNSIVGEQLPFLYLPLGTLRGPSVVLVRSPLPMRDVTALVRSAAREIDSTLPVRLSMPIESLIDRRLAQQRVFSWMLSLIGWLAFALAAVGLYGLLAQSVAERTREFGVRMALGSGRGRIFRLVLTDAAWIAGFGGLAGLALAAWGTRLIEAQLYGVTRFDPRVYGAAAVVLMVIVFVAALWPARSATRIQPVEALRAD
jgi:predicted permease